MLETDAIRITQMQESDVETLLHWSRSIALKRLSGPGPFLPSTRAALLKSLQATSHTQIQFALRPLQSDELLGHLGFQEIEWTNRTADLFIRIGEEHWGKGYGEQAIHLLLQYGFHELNLYRIQLQVVGYNERAIHLYKKLGFHHEGTLRQFGERDGQRFDFELYGMLVTEWRALQDLPTSQTDAR